MPCERGGGAKVVRDVRRANVYRIGEGASSSNAIRISPRLSRLSVIFFLVVWFVLVMLVLSWRDLSDARSMLFVAVLSFLILPFPYYAWRASFEFASENVNESLEPVFKAYEAEARLRAIKK